MHFCIMANYAPQALNSLMDNPTTNRADAARQLIEAAGGTLVALYSTSFDGPGAMVIFDVPDAAAAPAISGVLTASGSVHNIRLFRLGSQEEVVHIRQKAAQIRGAYKPPQK